MAKCTWPLNNEESLDFDIYEPTEVTWNDVAGLYIFTYIDGSTWYPVYIGQADSFKKRLPSHEKWDRAVQLGATHIHAMVVSQQTDRDLLEEQLIKYLQPVLNQQLR